jgi:hypothetical protein
MTTANPQKMYADAKLHLEVTGDDGVLLDRTYTTTILTTAGLHASLSAVAKTVTDDAAAERRDRWQVRPSGPTTVHARLELSFTRTNTSDNELFSVHEASMTTGGGPYDVVFAAVGVVRSETDRQIAQDLQRTEQSAAAQRARPRGVFTR